MSKVSRLGAQLYSGEKSIDFVGQWKRWYLISAAIILVAAIGLFGRGLNYGIEFEGGDEFQAITDNPSDKITDVQNAILDTEIEAASNPIVVASENTGNGTSTVRVQTEPLTPNERTVVQDAIESVTKGEVSTSSIGPTWGETIAKRALLGLVVFMVFVVLLIWGYMREWRMSLAGIVALAHDMIITVGVYALTGFEVTPATVTGFLTILGYSLYDTVVVFDKVRENTKNYETSTRRTYAESANLAVNQTLVRSINTTVVALIPTGAILYVGVVMLGSGPLKDLALALFVGMAAGAYSSIFIATPLLVQLKNRQPETIAQAKRVEARRNAEAKAKAREAAAEEPAPVELDGEPVPATTAPRKPRPQPAARPMSSQASKRAQPQRQARSKRNKGT
jgi:preprotein translocase subunit SecF